MATFGLRIDQVTFGAQCQRCRGDQLLADWIDRRIGHLGEELLEIIVKQLRFVGQYGQRGIRAHRTHWLNAVLRHGSDIDPKIFEIVAKRLQALQRRWMIECRLFFRNGGELVKVHEVIFQPFTVRLRLGHLLLDLFIANDAAFAGIDKKHSSGLETALFQNLLRGHVEHPDFRRHDDEIVLGHVVARRPEAVAVQHCTDHYPVGEGDGCRAVPRLHQAAVVFIKRPLLLIHAIVIFPGLRNHHHHGVRQRAAA